MRHDPQTPHIDDKQRTEGSRTDVERQKMQQQSATDQVENARKLGETRKGNTDEGSQPR